MQIQKRNGISYIRLNPGDHVACSEQAELSTLLGSCVAACLYDEQQRVIGMNHFVLPQNPSTSFVHVNDELPGRFGAHAMDQLIDDMLHKGARLNQIKAKVFGGANVIQSTAINKAEPDLINERNCRFVLDYLKGRNIPIVASDLCGNSARIIHFRSADFAVFMRTVTAVDTL